MNKKILIVRGDQQRGKALSFLLAGSGFQISAHSRADEAVEAARHQRFDLAITDESVPENERGLGFVAQLKEAQPSLPIVLIAKEQSLQTVISCIRAGVSEIVSSPDELRCVFECARGFLRSGGPDDVTWEDMLEVERLLASLSGSGAGSAKSSAGSAANPVEVEGLKRKNEDLLQERDRLARDLSDTLSQVEKCQTLINELKGDSGGGATDTEILERSAELDRREKLLNELSSKIGRQKVEVETELAELEAQRCELEEAKSEATTLSIAGDPAALQALKDAFEEERAQFVESRLDMQARIQDLERDLTIARSNEGSSDADKARLATLSEELHDARELLAERDFTIQAQAKRLAAAESGATPDSAAVQALEEEKRLLEIERFKLQEKLDRFENERRELEQDYEKRKREIQVERRDAEVSLREMQNAIKEEQLKLKVESATLKEEIRQFDQARQNFQEDVQDLQRKQADLRKLEAYLRQMESSSDSKQGNALPSPASDAPEAELRSGLLQEDISYASVPQPAGGAETRAPSGEKSDRPDTWSKPDFDKKAGRGPLRIGRKSSF